MGSSPVTPTKPSVYVGTRFFHCYYEHSHRCNVERSQLLKAVGFFQLFIQYKIFSVCKFHYDSRDIRSFHTTYLPKALYSDLSVCLSVQLLLYLLRKPAKNTIMRIQAETENILKLHWPKQKEADINHVKNACCISQKPLSCNSFNKSKYNLKIMYSCGL